MFQVAEVATNHKQRIWKTSKMNENIIKTLLGIASAGVIGCFAFLWNLNKAITELQVNQIEIYRIREEQNIKINNMALDIRDIRDRLIRIETIKPK